MKTYIQDYVQSYKSVYPHLVDVFANDFAAYLDGKPIQFSKSLTLLAGIYNPMSDAQTNRTNISYALEVLEAA